MPSVPSSHACHVSGKARGRSALYTPDVMATLRSRDFSWLCCLFLFVCPLQTINMPCSVAKVSSCGRACGRLLSCTNHSCQLKCHEVIGAADDTTSGDTCQTCDLGCEKPRLEGCTHPCLLTCHKNECPPCGQLIRMRCHCSMMLKHVGCDQWTHGDDRERIRLKSCGCKCPKKVLTDDISF